MSVTVTSIQGDTVDLLCLAQYGRTDGVTEAVLESNPHLRGLGPVLPIGTLVTLPDQPPAPLQSYLRFWQ